MPDNKEPFKQMPKLLRKWFQDAGAKGRQLVKPGAFKGMGSKLPRSVKDFDFDFKNIQLKSVSEYAPYIKLGLVVLAVYLLAQVAGRAIGLFIRPIYPTIPKKTGGLSAGAQAPTEDYDSIVRRNMFNVEGKIPDPYDQGRLDCFSQAKPTQQRIVLLGTIVMGDETHSVALIQEEGNPLKFGVRKDESFFDGKYLAMKVERKKFCFQVKATQDFEFVEIPDDSAGLGVSSSGGGGSTVGGPIEGITQRSETEFAVQKNTIDKQLLNLNEILQTARAVPYVEPGTGKFRGFLVQSIEPNSPFAQLGIRQGDVLTAVNDGSHDIVLDNAGKGLEAFQTFRAASSIKVQVLRGGQTTSLSYQVQ